MRTIKSSNEFFDILDSIKGGAIVTIGYVTSADLNIPIVQRKNPLTNRMKGYNDYSVFQNENGNEIGALVKVTSYNFNYRNRQSVHDEYHNKIKPQTNAIRQEFGIPDVQNKTSYKDVMSFGGNGQEVYKGDNESKFGNSYSPQNMFKPLHVKGVVYLVDKQGNIIRGLNDNEVYPYLKAKKEPSGVIALRKMGADEERIQEYIRRIKELKFSYRNFEANSILYIVATVNGEKIIYINDNLKRCVDDININPQDFIAVAKDRYKKDLQQIQEMILNNKKTIKENKHLMSKKLVRLTESDLHRIIKESVNNILTELDWKTYQSAAEKTYDNDDYDRAEKFADAATNSFNKDFGYEEFDDNLNYYGEKAKQDVNGRIYTNGNGQVVMGSYTPKFSSMHSVKSVNKDYTDFNPKSKMKPSLNTINKYNSANNEMDNFYNGNYEYQKGKGWVKK